jgi:hypothetical protein
LMCGLGQVLGNECFIVLYIILCVCVITEK